MPTHADLQLTNTERAIWHACATLATKGEGISVASVVNATQHIYVYGDVWFVMRRLIVRGYLIGTPQSCRLFVWPAEFFAMETKTVRYWWGETRIWNDGALWNAVAVLSDEWPRFACSFTGVNEDRAQAIREAELAMSDWILKTGYIGTIAGCVD